MDAEKALLIIFYRNPEPGKVKTRLAATLGDEKALDIYIKLVLHTESIANVLRADKVVFYADAVVKDDVWPDGKYIKHMQKGNDLGERMMHAFAYGFSEGYTSICIIGTDCLELTAPVVEEAFSKLQLHDTVMGPAKDGGYYLLGMKKLHRDLFINKKWSSDSVASDTLADIGKLNLSCFRLPALSDIDTENDLPESWRISN